MQGTCKWFNAQKGYGFITDSEGNDVFVHHSNIIMDKFRYLNEDDIVMIHDGNRCLVSSEIISNSLVTFRRCGSAVTAIPCVEAVFRSGDNGISSNITVPREQLFRTQTPHTYTFGKLLWAHEEAQKKGIRNTAASCTLMQELGETVYFSRGSEENLKITTLDDLMIFKALLHTKKDRWLK